MLLLIGLILFVAWLLGFFAFHVTAGLFHLVLLVAVIVVIVHLFSDNKKGY